MHSKTSRSRAGVQLDDINTLFSKPDYVNRFVSARASLGKQVGALLDSLPHEQDEINKLREGERPRAIPRRPPRCTIRRISYSARGTSSTSSRSTSRRRAEHDGVQYLCRPAAGANDLENGR